MKGNSMKMSECFGTGRGAGSVNPKPLYSKNVLSDDRIADYVGDVKGNLTKAFNFL